MHLCHLPTVPSAMAWHSDSVWFESYKRHIVISFTCQPVTIVSYCTLMYVRPYFTLLLQVKSVSYMILDVVNRFQQVHFLNKWLHYHRPPEYRMVALFKTLSYTLKRCDLPRLLLLLLLLLRFLHGSLSQQT